MLRFLGFASGVLLTGLVATAQDLPTIEAPTRGLQPLATTDEIRPFAAVGRLDTGDGFCTATLIAADLVLTAAHCLFAGSPDARRPDSAFVFNAGLRNGRVSAQRGVIASFIHPGYAYGAPDHLDRVRTDIAILRLDRPITDGSVIPIPVRGTAGHGDDVQVVSYGEERENFASLEEGCSVLAEDPGILLLSCSVVHGSSGAPVMIREGAGYAIVSVVSAAAHWRDEPVALSAELDGAIDTLLQVAGTRAPGVASADLPTVRSLSLEDDGRATSGARFIQP